MIYYEKDGEYKPLGCVLEDLNLESSTDEPKSFNTETLTWEATIDAGSREQLRKIIPKGYRNAENLKRDGYLNSSNAELE